MPLLQDYNKLFEHTDNIKKIYVNNNVVWPAKLKDYSEPFYVENITNINETLSIKKSSSSAPTLTIEYSTDKESWNILGTTSTTALTYTLQPNDKIYLRCNTTVWSTIAYNNKIDGVSKVGGNIMSLLYGSNFTGQEKIFPTDSSYSLSNLFYENNKLVDASVLLLSATTLTQTCYSDMFYGCTSLVTAPALPATTLANYCYANMFYGCTSLVTAPALPATTMTQRCYSRMFWGCTSLVTAPALPATTLANYCYSDMFYGCTSLVTAPALPATTLTQSCYESMFSGCTLLNNITCLATDISASNATYIWLRNVSSTGTFTKVAGVTWSTGASGIPSGWTVVEV